MVFGAPFSFVKIDTLPGPAAGASDVGDGHVAVFPIVGATDWVLPGVVQRIDILGTCKSQDVAIPGI
jgi:hypothetical protein